MYTCPVCRYDRLEKPPLEWAICPQCGTEFEYDDAVSPLQDVRDRWAALRTKWEAAGRPIFDPEGMV